MKPPTLLSSLTLTLFLIFSFPSPSSSSSFSSSSSPHHFLKCLTLQHFHNYSSITTVLYTPNNSSFTSILRSPIKNLRFATEAAPLPQAIITPIHESQVPPLILCARETGVEIRTRSGGHDFEGLSSVSQAPFVIIDLINLSEISVDVGEKTAWVGAGSTIGSLYYRIAEKSPVLGFPAGTCPTVGVGGHFSGGGYGTLLRKYGLSADNVIDARIVDANGRILDRESMGEDLFWAIRGGGGASFGVIVAWKVQLVDVSETVTVFRVSRTLEQNAAGILHRWQYVAPEMDKDLFVGVMIVKAANTTTAASFFSLFLGGADRLLQLVQESFPELGLVREDCIEMSWIKSIIFIQGAFPVDTPPVVLLDRFSPLGAGYTKIKSNYVQKPIPRAGLEGAWRYLDELKPEAIGVLILSPYGGRMAEISDAATPFPHRAGNLYSFSHYVSWGENDDTRDSGTYIRWSRRLYDYLTPYVSRNPRAAYVNYRDLDLGVNNPKGRTSYARASIWGKKYFNNNFHRLVRVKTMVDPDNFFRSQQTIPPLYSKKGN